MKQIQVSVIIHSRLLIVLEIVAADFNCSEVMQLTREENVYWNLTVHAKLSGECDGKSQDHLRGILGFFPPDFLKDHRKP